jgi:uncharacterized membrane protein
MLYAADRINGSVLWANLHLLFWLSLMPFTTAWMGQNHFTRWPVIAYGVVLIMCGLAYWQLSASLIGACGKDSQLAQALGKDRKGKLSVAIYAVAIALAFVNPWLAFGLYVVVEIIWFIPDPRIEEKITG